MARPRKAALEGAATAVPGELAQIVASFRSAYPELWDELALCPLQHGLETMIEKLRHG
jgi:hypothetical protein